MKIIAFSLYGKLPIYTLGALENAKLVPLVYPGWQMIVWHDNSVEPEILAQLTSLGAALRNMATSGIANGMLWRFLANDEPGMQCYISRDCDSRLNQRESEAVAEWLAGDAGCHIMRDHPHHDQIMMGGMWGARAGVIPSMRQIISDWQARPEYGNDQQFLARKIWPLVKHSCVQHCFGHLVDRFPDAKTFPAPAKLGNWRFVGEVFDAENNPRPHDWEMRINDLA